MFRSRIHIAFVVLSLALIVAACGPSGPREFIVVDQREILGDVFTETTGDVNNEDGDEFLYQDLAVLREFRHSMDINFTPDGQSLNRADVEERILNTYDLPDRSGDKQCLIPADVPPGSIHRYDIEWTEVIREGNIEEGSVAGQGSILGTYRIVVDLQCQTVGVVSMN